LKTSHAPIWKDEEVKNVHLILNKPWNDKGKGTSDDETHLWWWEADEERQTRERAVGLVEPQVK
jgi:hypothetical protein